MSYGSYRYQYWFDFENCSNVEEVHFTVGNGSAYNHDSSSYDRTPWYYSRNHPIKIIIDSDVKAIGEKQFYCCTGLCSITYDGVEYTKYSEFSKAFTDNGGTIASDAFAGSGIID